MAILRHPNVLVRPASAIALLLLRCRGTLPPYNPYLIRAERLLFQGFLGVCLQPPMIVTEYCSRGSLYKVLKHARESPEVLKQLTWSVRLKIVSHTACLLPLNCSGVFLCYDPMEVLSAGICTLQTKHQTHPRAPASIQGCCQAHSAVVCRRWVLPRACITYIHSRSQSCTVI